MATDPAAVIRAWFDELWNQGREEALGRLLAADAHVYGLSAPEDRPLRGPGDFSPFYRAFRAAFPDLRVEVVRTLTEGSMVAAHCRVTGTHSGDAVAPPASGKRVEFWGMCIVRVENGKIVEGWNAFDFLALYQQIGRQPPPRA